jgi:succinyl-diaminopimelate desuccinylase
MDVISLTRDLLSFNNINPPGNEEEIAEFKGNFLKGYGFSSVYYEFGDKRLYLVAEKGLSGTVPQILLTGHFDTVPPGYKKWSIDPFAGQVYYWKI